jgi:hypothetical protein
MTPIILNSPLCLGGVWYWRGSRVELPDDDARVMVGRRLAELAPVVHSEPKLEEVREAKVGDIMTKSPRHKEKRNVPSRY